ncbi:hypothetical protein DRQ18_06915, partial [bacterium]
ESVFYFTGSNAEVLMNTGYHTLEILVRDDAWAVSKETLRIKVKTVKRAWVTDTILLLDETKDDVVPYVLLRSSLGNPISDPDAFMDNFYMDVIGAPIKQIDISYTTMDYSYYEKIARYAYIVYVSDDAFNHMGWTDPVARMFVDYLNTGGHLLAWGLLLINGLVSSAENYGISFYRDKISINDPRSPEEYEFVGPISVMEDYFPTLTLNTAILDSLELYVDKPVDIAYYSPDNHALSAVTAADPVSSYIIYLYDSYTNDPLYESSGCGFRYRNDTYGVVLFTFPLHWMEMDDNYEPVKTVVQNSLKYLKGEILEE